MIAELSVSQLAIIEQTAVRLEPGFTVLTGETGAGKSLLIDAIQLALGDRADSELVRADAKSANVSVVFDLNRSPELLDLCEELGVSTEDSMLFVTRELFAEGRSQCRIGGRLVPASVLRRLGDALVDLHGQHDHQSLLNQEQHLDTFDLWIGQSARDLRSATRERFQVYSEAKRRLESLRADIQSRERKLDLLSHQIEEITQVDPKPGEFSELQSTLSRLQNLEQLLAATSGAKECVSDAEGSALELSGAALKFLESAQKFDPAISGMVDQIREIVFGLEDVSTALAKFLDGLDSASESPEAISNRLETLKKLRRKYGEDEAAILESLQAAQLQMDALQDVEANEAALENLTASSWDELEKLAQELSTLRRAKAAIFGREIEAELKDLALPNARFGVGLKPAAPSASGADEVEFVFSANPGEPLRPLQRVASGGEVSRLMLALKTVLAGKASVPTLIFDEIDSGLGGRVGSIVGRKLADLSANYQVLVISHLPQVAALADHHFRIEKSESAGRTATRVRPLNQEERLEEIARMLAGEQLTETALAHARQLLGTEAQNARATS